MWAKQKENKHKIKKDRLGLFKRTKKVSQHMAKMSESKTVKDKLSLFKHNLKELSCPKTRKKPNKVSQLKKYLKMIEKLMLAHISPQS